MTLDNTRRQTLLSASAALGLASIMPATAWAQEAAYPDKPVKIVVGFSAGTPPEVFARLIADRFSKTFKQSVIVENRPGAGSTIASGQVAKSKPDGLTLLLGVASGLSSGPHLIPNVTYDPRTDFDPIGFVQRGAYFISARSDLPIRSLKDLIEYSRSSSRPLSFGTPGVGTLHHLIWEVLQAQTGIQLTHVPYPGTPQMVNEAIAGRLDLMLEGASSLTVPHVKSGKIQYIAMTGAKRSPNWPNVPTATEQGYPQIESESWWVLVAPKGTPEPILKTLRTELLQVLSSQEAQSLLESLGAQGDNGQTSTEQLRAFIRSEYERWGAVIRKANIKPS
jgi:tripartite-type tricarboxylate transporter receptor subunit TctC